MTLHLVGNDGSWEIQWHGDPLPYLRVPKVKKFDGIYYPQTLPRVEEHFEVRIFRLTSMREDREFAIYIEE